MRGLIVVLVLTRVAFAEPPSAYQCTPGTANKGVGCTCPTSHREKRDAENTALCAAKPTATAAQQLLALVNKYNLTAAIELAKKNDFDKATYTAVTAVFGKWLVPIGEQVKLLASRGQCSAANKLLDGAKPWRTLIITMFGRHVGNTDFKDETIAFLEDMLDQALEPLTKQRQACLDTASKDDGTAQIKAAYDAGKAVVAKCFDNVPAPKGPATLRVVVDADGAVADTKLTATWPDLDVKLVNMRLEMTRLDEIWVREQCFVKAAAGWTFKPNARGFAASIPVSK
jgi:hypothetical protein